MLKISSLPCARDLPMRSALPVLGSERSNLRTTLVAFPLPASTASHHAIDRSEPPGLCDIELQAERDWLIDM